jgi:hypothetical protein
MCRQQRIHKLGEPIRFHLDFREEFSSGLFIPLDIGSAQTSDEALDVTQWQTQLVRSCREL